MQTLSCSVLHVDCIQKMDVATVTTHCFMDILIPHFHIFLSFLTKNDHIQVTVLI